MRMRRTQIGITAQFFLSYCIVGIGAAILATFLTTMRLQPLTVIAGAGLAAGLAGLLLTANIQRGLQRIDRALLCLAQGQPAGKFDAGWFWPLDALFIRVRQLNQAIGEQAGREALSAEQRAQLLQSVGEAAAQEERNRLARELHDSIKQQIFSIGISAAAIEARLPGGQGTLETPLSDIQQSVQAAQSEMEALVQQLHPAPLGLAGVIESLRIQCQALAYRMNGQATVEIGTLPPDERLAPTTGDALQRIFQEALSNIARHARAHRVSVSIGQQEDALLVEVHDDGQGFVVDEPRHGLGLENMRMRASALGGSLHVQSRPGETRISLSLPLLATSIGPLVEERKAIERQMRRIQTLHEGADIVLQLTYLCILLVLPFALVGLGLCLTLICFGLAYAGRRRIVRLASASSKEALVLSSRGNVIAVSLSLLCGLCAWYLPVILPGHTPWLPAGVSLVVVALVLLAGWQYQGSTVAYLRHLSSGARADEGKERLHQIQQSFAVWLVIAVLALIIGQFDLAFPPRTALQWSSGATLVLLLLWPLLLLASYIQHRFLIGKAATFEAKGESDD